MFGGMGGRDDNRSSGLIELLVLGILAPIMAMIIQLAISRSREYLADETGAKLLHNSTSLASALEKIEKSVTQNPFMRIGTTQATAHLFISNPLRASHLLELFSTHPSTEKRVERLRKMRL